MKALLVWANLVIWWVWIFIPPWFTAAKCLKSSPWSYRKHSAEPSSGDWRVCIWMYSLCQVRRQREQVPKEVPCTWWVWLQAQVLLVPLESFPFSPFLSAVPQVWPDSFSPGGKSLLLALCPLTCPLPAKLEGSRACETVLKIFLGCPMLLNTVPYPNSSIQGPRKPGPCPLFQSHWITPIAITHRSVHPKLFYCQSPETCTDAPSDHLTGPAISTLHIPFLLGSLLAFQISCCLVKMPRTLCWQLLEPITLYCNHLLSERFSPSDCKLSEDMNNVLIICAPHDSCKIFQEWKVYNMLWLNKYLLLYFVMRWNNLSSNTESFTKDFRIFRFKSLYLSCNFEASKSYTYE